MFKENVQLNLLDGHKYLKSQQITSLNILQKKNISLYIYISPQLNK